MLLTCRVCAADVQSLCCGRAQFVLQTCLSINHVTVHTRITFICWSSSHSILDTLALSIDFHYFIIAYTAGVRASEHLGERSLLLVINVFEKWGRRIQMGSGSRLSRRIRRDRVHGWTAAYSIYSSSVHARWSAYVSICQANEDNATLRLTHQ